MNARDICLHRLFALAVQCHIAITARFFANPTFGQKNEAFCFGDMGNCVTVGMIVAALEGPDVRIDPCAQYEIPRVTQTVYPTF